MNMEAPLGDESLRNVESGRTSICSNETTPLLSASPSEASLEIAKRDTTDPYLTAARKEVQWMLSSSSLTILALMLQSSFFFVNVLAVSHLGAKELAAMSLAVTCTGIIALAPTFGLMSAMDTFCSTAYTASRDKTLVGFHFQRGLIAAFTHLIVAAPILWYAENILLAIRQDPEIAHLSGLYLRIQILGVLAWSIFEACKRYLQAQEIMRAGTIVMMIVAPFHWINNYIFVRSETYGLGFIGAPIINIVSNWMLVIGIVIYTCNSRAKETWGGWDRRAFHNMQEFYKLAIPSVITVCAEWICFELLTIGTSYFGANQLAGQAIVLNSVILIFQLSNGLGFGTSPRIGNLIGAGKPRQARIAADMAVAASTVIGIAGTLFLSIYGNWWIAVYTDDLAVAKEAAKLMPIACLFLISDGLNAVLGAILRGLGRQQISAGVYMFGFYICAVPVAIYLSFIKHMQAYGLWNGLCIGVFVSSALQLLYIYKWVDWKNEVRLCLSRLQQSQNNSS
ncbi:mate-domain-containing protein [Coemansia mojavensis]|nr:mate-domain-containing protein [Coemansia mojavensis]KAJ2650842.1 ethionine resistance protein [Coemansia sp. RSA 1250]